MVLPIALRRKPHRLGRGLVATVRLVHTYARLAGRPGADASRGRDGLGVMKARRLVAAAAAALALLTGAGLAPSATASPRAPERDAAPKVYIVKTRSTSAAGGVAGRVRTSGGRVEHVYRRAFRGFSARLSAAQVQALYVNES